MASIDIPDKLMNALVEFCNLNEVEDKEKEIIDILILGFNVKKYGTTPFKTNTSSSSIIKKEEPTKVETKKIENNVTEEIKTEEKPRKKVKIVKIKNNGNV